MAKTASIDTLTNYAPYAMMAYGNTLAAPPSFTHDDGGSPLSPKDVTKQRIRHLLKGLTYTSAGYAATRTLFNKDFDPEASEFHTPGMWNSLKREAVELAHHQGVPRFLLPKVKAAEYLIKSALENTGKKEEPSNPSAWSIPLALAGGTAVNVGLQKVQSNLGQNVMSDFKETIDPQFRSRLRKAMGAEHIPHVAQNPFVSTPFFSSREVSGPSHDAFSDMAAAGQAKGKERLTDFLRQRGFVSGAKDMPYDVLAHEYGHATGSRKLMGLYPRARSFAQYGGPVSTLAAGLLANPEDSFAKSLGRGALHGSAIGLVGSSPMLAEELRATLRGLKGLSTAGASSQRMSQARMRLGGAFGTYAGGVLLNHAMSGALGGVVGRYAKSKFRKPGAPAEEVQKT